MPARLATIACAGFLHTGCAGLAAPSSALEGAIAAPPPTENLTARVTKADNPVPKQNSVTAMAEQPEPLNEVGQATIAKADLWSKLRDGMVLDHRIEEKRVAQELRWFQQNPDYWIRLAPRMQRYLPYILEQVRARDLPTELALLPIIESALDPYAFSPYGANGLWQFMRPTAKQYGLTINPQYDGRRDVVASTTAALDFLEDLYRRFDDWPLALAAYNAGGGTVSKALRKSDSRDFFGQRLPRETQAYVPRLLAISAIVANPDAYGIPLPAVDDTNPLIFLSLPGSFDVSVVAQTLSVDPAQVYEFNPALKQARWSAADSLQLILPRNWQRNGSEPLEPIDQLVSQEGNLPTPEPPLLASATTMIDAKTEAMARLQSIPPKERMVWLTVVVRSGDTLSEIAKIHNLTAKDLRRLNQLDTDLLQIGQKLQVPVAKNLERATNSDMPVYTVRPGDSLWLIAKRLDTKVSTLVKLNKIGPRDVLGIGQKIVVPNTGFPAALTDTLPNKIRKIQYRVRRGDSLSRIAQRFSLRVGDIVQWNDLKPRHYLQPGQGLTLYVDVIGG